MLPLSGIDPMDMVYIIVVLHLMQRNLPHNPDMLLYGNLFHRHQIHLLITHPQKDRKQRDSLPD
jgi:hypothetical protein